MNTPDKQRILALEAQVASLTDELHAWRAYEGERTPSEEEAREDRMRANIRRLVPPSHRRSRGVGPAITRLLIRFIDRPGQVVTTEDAYRAVVGTLDSEVAEDIIKVRVCYVRDILTWCGLKRSDIETTWGRGYTLRAEVVPHLRAMLERDVMSEAA